MSTLPYASRPLPLRAFWLMAASPAVAMFVSSNVANAGNLVFNMLFSRWMGPELFAQLATLLTVKLSLLALLNAVQMAVSQQVSGSDAQGDGALWRLNRLAFVGLALVVPLAVPAALSGALGRAVGVQSASAVMILLFALPVTAPLCLARGVAVGRLQVGRIIWSANLEMAVRLGGGVLAWQAGLGLTGVVAALALSLLAGWLPVRGALRPGPGLGVSPLARRVAVLALPFAVLQAAQVAHLDGDVLVANALLSPTDTGLVAVLSLFQRIQFFACFGLAAVLLPLVTAAAARGDSGFRQAGPVAAVFAGVSLPLMAVLVAAPDRVIGLLAGPAFAGAAPALPLAGLCAVLFTLSYLLATFLAALGDRRGIWLIAGFVPVQLGAFALLGQSEAGLALGGMILAKALCQTALAASLLTLLLWRSRARRF
jgi:O-antigen/teichoic acid export membrane protein